MKIRKPLANIMKIRTCLDLGVFLPCLCFLFYLAGADLKL